MVDYSNSKIAEAIDEFVHNKRDREVLKLRLIDGLTYEKIAEQMDLSPRAVKYIIYRGQDKVFRHLG